MAPMKAMKAAQSITKTALAEAVDESSAKHHEDCPGRSCCWLHRFETIRLRQGFLGPCRCRGAGNQENWKGHHPWRRHAEDPDEASHQSWEERNVRQTCGCEGQASSKSGEGLPRRCHQEGNLSSSHAKSSKWPSEGPSWPLVGGPQGGHRGATCVANTKNDGDVFFYSLVLCNIL